MFDVDDGNGGDGGGGEYVDAEEDTKREKRTKYT